VALLCLAALLCGDAVRGIHLLTARHVVCAAHGELVEAESVGESSHIDGDGDGATAATSEGDSDHHEHCSVAAAPTRPFATWIPGAALAGVAPRDEATIAPSAPTEIRSRAVLQYAPKQGPPVRDVLQRS
jgi:hypothetical protein